MRSRANLLVKFDAAARRTFVPQIQVVVMQLNTRDPHSPPISYSMFAEHRHVCAFFDGPWDEDAAMLPFLKEGLEHGERTFCIVDPASRPSYVDRLEQGGIPVSAAEQRGQLELRNWDDAYLRNGHFDQEAMLALIEEVLSAGKASGFPQTRLLAHMEWCLDDRPGVDDIVEYETRLNYILPKYHDPVVCAYETGKYDGAMIMDILRTHPMVIVGGVLRENPFFVPPEEFLSELRRRRAPTPRS